MQYDCAREEFFLGKQKPWHRLSLHARLRHCDPHGQCSVGHTATLADAAGSVILKDIASMPFGRRQGRCHVLHTRNEIRV